LATFLGAKNPYITVTIIETTATFILHGPKTSSSFLGLIRQQEHQVAEQLRCDGFALKEGFFQVEKMISHSLKLSP